MFRTKLRPPQDAVTGRRARGHRYNVMLRRAAVVASTLLFAPACGQSVSDGLGASETGATSLTATAGSTGSTSDPGTTGPEKFDIGEGETDGNGGDNETGCKAVDLLFVIDNSGSMSDEQQNLIASFPGFISGIQSQLKYQSYHVGILATDAYAGNPAQCQKLGALVTGTVGENSSEGQCGPYALGNYITSSDDFVASFECAARLGTQGSGNEQPMEAIVAAMEPENNDLTGCNDGFLRDEALLVVVVITDEEDDHEQPECGNPFGANSGSAGDPPAWYDAIVAAKGGNENAVVVLSLVGPPGPDPKICPSLDKCGDAIIGAEKAMRITELTNMFTFGFLGRVCEDSYESFFNASIAHIVEACDQFPPQG